MTKRKPPKITYYGAKAIRQDEEPIVCALDVETDGLGGALKMVQWGNFAGVFHDSSDNAIGKFLASMWNYPAPCIWYSHFASYDWRYLLDELQAIDGVEIDIGMRTHTDIYELRVTYEGEKYILRDSYAIFPHPLKALAERFCPELPKLDLDFDSEVFDPEDPRHVAYARRDIEILLAGLPRFFEMVKTTFSVWPTGTVAGTALKSWQRHIGDELYNCSKYDGNELFIRQGYYGGLVFLTNNNTNENAETYDRNSSYPATMLEHGVPYGRQYECRDFESGRPGIYRVRVKAPDDLIVPIIPARNAKGGMRWYRGEFDTVCTNNELIFAANHGYEIQKIYEGIAFEDTVFPFKEFIELCKFIRANFKGEALEFVAKLLQNALYGKFGSRRERLKVISALTADVEMLMGAIPLDENGDWYTRTELDEDMRCMPSWAAFITANSRLNLLQNVYTVGPENCFYGDTDSITIKAGYGHLIDIGNEYGQWKLEKEWRTFRAIAPKVYAGELLSGKLVGAAKGMPRKAVDDGVLRELLMTGQSEVSALSLASLKSHLKNGGSKAVTLTRKSSTLNNSVNYEICEGGQVRAKIAA